MVPAALWSQKRRTRLCMTAAGKWIEKTQVELNNTWQPEPFPAAFETIREFRRIISYFPEN